MEARVKQDYRFGTVSALVGRRFNKKDWTPIPAELEAEAEAHPFLEIRGKKVTPVPVEEPPEAAETLAAEMGVKLDKPSKPGSKK